MDASSSSCAETFILEQGVVDATIIVWVQLPLFVSNHHFIILWVFWNTWGKIQD
jgi:hypothetical protein